MKKSRVMLIIGLVFLILIGIVLWNRFAGTNEESTTATTIPATSTTITIQATTTTTIDLERTILCEVLEKEFCKSGILEHIFNGSYIGFNLPAGTPIFSPRDGRVTFIFDVSEAEGFAVDISEGDIELSAAKNIFEIVYTNDESQTVKDYITKGEMVATVGETNLPFKEFNAYNLVLLIRKDASGVILDINKEFNLGLAYRSDEVQPVATSTSSP